MMSDRLRGAQNVAASFVDEAAQSSSQKGAHLGLMLGSSFSDFLVVPV